MNMNLKFKSIIVMMIGALLTGCVAVVVAGAAAGMVYDRRSVTTMEADARLFHVIHKTIIKDLDFGTREFLFPVLTGWYCWLDKLPLHHYAF